MESTPINITSLWSASLHHSIIGHTNILLAGDAVFSHLLADKEWIWVSVMQLLQPKPFTHIYITLSLVNPVLISYSQKRHMVGRRVIVIDREKRGRSKVDGSSLCEMLCYGFLNFKSAKGALVCRMSNLIKLISCDGWICFSYVLNIQLTQSRGSIA